MPRVDFATLVFQGARFEGDMMPIEVLPELSAYRDVIVAVARSLFQQQNPARKRLPKGFEKSFRLVLERVESGSSVVPIITRVTDSANLFPDIFDAARDLVEDGIAAIAAGRERDPRVSVEVLARFSGLGRSLTGDEKLIIARPGTREGAVYDRGIRQKILRAAETSHVDTVDIVGEVRAADKDAEGFALRTADGRKFDVKAPSLFIPLAVKWLGESAAVRVRGTGVYDAKGRLERVGFATDVSLAEEEESVLPLGSIESIHEQIVRLASLGKGWFDQTSEPYDQGHLAWAEAVLEALIGAFQLPTPYLYPMPEMAVRAEWSTSALEVLLSLDPSDRTASVLAVDLQSEHADELKVSLREPGSESALGSFLRGKLRQERGESWLMSAQH